MVRPLPPQPALTPGEYAPWFACGTPSNPAYNFNTAAGRYVLLGFLPADPQARAAALAPFRAVRDRFDDVTMTAFLVIRDAPSIAAAQNEVPGLRWFQDADGAVSRLYGALAADGADHPHWLLLDPALAVIATAPTDAPAPVFDAIAALPPVADHAGVPLHAPVLIVPRVFEPALCRRLIAHYEATGGAASGVMRDVGGRTIGVLDGHKRRRDAPVDDPDFRKLLMARLRRRLVPEIAKVFHFEATRLERYIVACYDAAEGGYFKPHRDNETFGTAHRRFAVSINLNAEAFEGGDLRFPEFGPRTYRPPTGGAVVFSCALQHEATPVTRGVRYAFLPFLYDEDGARLREANLSKLEVA